MLALLGEAVGRASVLEGRGGCLGVGREASALP
ncbi:hypothetical protein BJ978_000236 [Agromyces terreus]|uniref:Uncharacterized protein n=1 Tax=Agromyces terreus TaxID=424795 RepID=A0A9X2GYK7_9MICO|nr:hypothetical protein [Agromyces terreus]